MSATLSDLIAELRAGLDGVTPGPWACFYKSKYDEWHVSVPAHGHTAMKTPLFIDGCPTGEKDASHIARCSPDNIRILLDHIASLQAERNAARAEAAEADRLAEALRVALEPFAKACSEHFNDWCPDETPAWYVDDEDGEPGWEKPASVTVGDFRTAARALSSMK
jgi:hypothetical protein